MSRSRLPLFPDLPRPLWFAHRGCSYRAPENTLPAFRLAREYGIPGVELDLQLTADGEIIVFHDADFSRIGAAPHPVRETPLKEIRRLDAGLHKDPGFAGTRIPTFRELLEEMAEDLLFDIELKYYAPDDVHALVAGVAELIEEFRLQGRAVISSFDPRILRRAKRRMPHIPHGLIYDESSLPFWFPRRRALGYSRADFEKPVHRLGVRKGREALVWTVDDPATAAATLRAGAAGIISNRPEDLR